MKKSASKRKKLMPASVVKMLDGLAKAKRVPFTPEDIPEHLRAEAEAIKASRAPQNQEAARKLADKLATAVTDRVAEATGKPKRQLH